MKYDAVTVQAPHRQAEQTESHREAQGGVGIDHRLQLAAASQIHGKRDGLVRQHPASLPHDALQDSRLAGADNKVFPEACLRVAFP